MEQKIRLVQKAILFGFLLSLTIVGVAFATQITLDGNPSDWEGEGDPLCVLPPPLGCALVATDPDEQPDDVTGIRDQYDIEEVWFTNDSTNAYWRIDTYANIDFTRQLEHIDICIDTDNNPNNNYDDDTCNSIGAELMVQVFRFNGVNSVTVYSCTAVDCTTFVGTGGIAIANNVMELSAPISALGFTDGTTYRQAVYFDNQDSDNDDHVPDAGSTNITVGTGSPTAITLASLTARSGNVYAVPLLVGSLLLLAALLLVLRRVRGRVA